MQKNLATEVTENTEFVLNLFFSVPSVCSVAEIFS